MAKLIDKDDNVLTDSNDILQEVKSFFYEKLQERRDVKDCEICPRQLDLNSYYKKKRH